MRGCRVTLAVLVLGLLAVGCGDDSSEGSADEYCRLSAELGAASGQPSDEKLDAVVDAAPDEIKDDAETLANAVREDDFSGDEVDQAAQNLEEWEAENCDFENGGD